MKVKSFPFGKSSQLPSQAYQPGQLAGAPGRPGTRCTCCCGALLARLPMRYSGASYVSTGSKRWPHSSTLRLGFMGEASLKVLDE